MAQSKAYRHPELSDVSLETAMQALSDPGRLAIVRALLAEPERELACHEIECSLSKATVSHHFETLREAGLIRTRVEGRKCLSSVRRDEFEGRFPGLLALVESGNG